MCLNWQTILTTSSWEGVKLKSEKSGRVASLTWQMDFKATKRRWPPARRRGSLSHNPSKMYLLSHKIPVPFGRSRIMKAKILNYAKSRRKKAKRQENMTFLKKNASTRTLERTVPRLSTSSNTPLQLPQRCSQKHLTIITINMASCMAVHLPLRILTFWVVPRSISSQPTTQVIISHNSSTITLKSWFTRPTTWTLLPIRPRNSVAMYHKRQGLTIGTLTAIAQLITKIIHRTPRNHNIAAGTTSLPPCMTKTSNNKPC